MKKLLSAPILFWLLASLASADDKNPPSKPAQSIPELQLQVEKILKDTHTPGVAVAIVHREGPDWLPASPVNPNWPEREPGKHDALSVPARCGSGRIVLRQVRGQLAEQKFLQEIDSGVCADSDEGVFDH